MDFWGFTDGTGAIEWLEKGVLVFDTAMRAGLWNEVSSPVFERWRFKVFKLAGWKSGHCDD